MGSVPGTSHGLWARDRSARSTRAIIASVTSAGVESRSFRADEVPKDERSISQLSRLLMFFLFKLATEPVQPALHSPSRSKPQLGRNLVLAEPGHG